MPVADVSVQSIAELVSLNGRCAVVTGAAQGIGKAIARRLAEAGASVLIGDLKVELARAAAEELATAFGVKAMATELDVTQEASVVAAAELTQRELGGLDIWVNNAGIFPNVPLLQMTEALWDEVMAINLKGVFLGSREAARRMVAHGGGGVIVNVASLAAFKGVAPGVAAYVASKHGVRGATKQMALELAPHGIRVLGVAPTFVASEGAMAAFSAMPDVAKHNPSTLSTRLGRIGVPDDVARVALFCASDLALFMTGSTLLVDAGQGI